MPGHGEKYGHLVGQHVDEVVEKIKSDGLEARVYQNLGLIQTQNPSLVQVQVDPNTKLVKKVS